MRIVPVLLLAAGFATAALPAVADDNAAPGRVPTVTRLVKICSTLENDLNAAILRRDSAALDRMLAPDFEMRAGAMPGRPIPRAAWLAQALSDPPFTWRNEQMAAHEYGNVVVVSFLWNVETAAGTDVAAGFAPRLFVVDTWIQDAGNWRLGTRYVSPASEARVPGLPNDTGDLPKKY